ncbi:DUF418 domain-containing protein [Salinactinospora qingdaonensis]|uniref:DUF418 domain-containing protein n=1 Tax=Salinactinospora qingdaonensis TaxID=702744 RepID=A0ABP7FDA8_9ACTN
MSTWQAAVRGPTTSTERALAPDLARGFMLLLIALANTVWYLWAAPSTGINVHPTTGSTLDRITQFTIITAVDGRVFPMFAFLFGYGMVHLFNRQRAAGVSDRAASAVLRRRNLWLLVFGFVHAALLFIGDILGAYGLAGLVLGGLFLRRGNRTLGVWACVLSGLLALLLLVNVLAGLALALVPQAAQGQAATTDMSFLTGSFGEEDALAAVAERAMLWPLFTLWQAVALVIPAAILLGMWAARHRILEEPGHHRRLLWGMTLAGVAVAWLCALPEALYHVGVFDVSAVTGSALSGIRSLSGLAGGVGYVALFGLLGGWLAKRGRQGVAVTAVAAVGKRSLSCYLAQSVICAPVLAAWGLGLGGSLTSASMAAFAIGVWLVTVLGAYALERANRRGPAEALLRNLSYGPAAAAQRDRESDDSRQG